jgi:2-(1,2-epoxy-1,2-dihydrophenyl)acetyl-CoA isomerase
MNSDMIGFAVESGVCTLTLRNPTRRNALNAGMRKLLLDYLGLIETSDDIRSVLLTGDGPVFCAGQDLEEDVMQVDGHMAPDIGRVLHGQYHPIYRALYRLTKPTVCAVNGAAIGGGATLAMACDFAVAGHSTRFAFPYVRLGLGLDAGASFFLVRRAGIARATELAMFGEPIDAKMAVEWGLIWKSVDDSAVLESARDTALRLAQGAPSALAGVKIALASAAMANFDHQLDYERDLQRWISMMPDYRAGLQAFKSKEKPVFGYPYGDRQRKEFPD